MNAINSIQAAKAAFPQLRWRDEGPGVAFAICGGDRESGDITIFLAMENGAIAPEHTHNERKDWPFRETIICLAGTMYGVDPHDKSFVLEAGKSKDLKDDTPHQPYVHENGFALVLYRQPAGHTLT